MQAFDRCIRSSYKAYEGRITCTSGKIKLTYEQRISVLWSSCKPSTETLGKDLGNLVQES